MAFRASNQALADGYVTAKRAANQLKTNCQDFNAQMSAGNTPYSLLQDVYLTLQRADDQFASIAALSGMAQYARDQEDDQTYDVVAEFTAMRNAVASTQTWMETNVPVTNRTLAAVSTWGTPVELVADTFTTAQTSGLRTELDAVIASIV